MLTLAACLGGCRGNAPEESTLSLMEASRRELATAVEERDQLLMLVKDISLDMAHIKKLEGLTPVASDTDRGNRLQRKQILSDIARVKRTLAERRRQLAELEERLQKSSLFSEELQATIGALRSQIDLQAAEIETLRIQLSDANEHIGHLNRQVDSLNSTVAQVEEKLDVARDASLQLEEELNTCYYAVGSKSELKTHGILESGFLKKTKLLKGDFDRNFFLPADRRTLVLLPLGSPKARLLTNHPQSSYEIISDSIDGGLKTLLIIDSDEFWRLTGYLVVQTD